MKKLIMRKICACSLFLIFFTVSIFLASCKNIAKGGGGGGSGGGSSGGGTPAPTGIQEQPSQSNETDLSNVPSQPSQSNEPSQPQQQTLTFNFDASGAYPESQTATEIVVQGSTVTFADIKSNGGIQDPSKTGEILEGWFYNGTIRAGDTDTFSGSTTFTAKFTPAGVPSPTYQKLTFTFESEGTTVETVEKEVEQGSSVAFSIIVTGVTNPTKANHNFEYWVDSNGNQVNDADEFDADTIFNAKFAEITPPPPTTQTLTFTFMSEGTTVETVTKDVTQGDSVAFSAIKDSVTNPTKAGQNFICWVVGSGTTPVNDADTFDKDAIFNAVFTEIKETLTFTFTAGGSSHVSQTVEKEIMKGSSVKFADIKASVTSPTKAYHNFDYWIDGDGNKVNDDATFGANTEFTAKFTEIKQTLIFTFMSDGTTFRTVTKEVTQGSTIQFSDIVADVATNPIKTGNNFVGWVVGTNTSAYTVKNSASFNANTTFTAKFTAKPTLTFTFVADGADPVTQTVTREVTPGGSVAFSDIKVGVTPPSKPGHGFLGWVEGSGTTTVQNNANFNASTTFTAKFEAAAGDDSRKLELAPGKEKAEVGDVIYKDGGKNLIGSKDQAGDNAIMGYVYKADADGVQVVSSNNVHASATWSENNKAAVYAGYLGTQTSGSTIPDGRALLSDAVQGAENGFDAWLKIAQWNPTAVFKYYNAIATSIIEKKNLPRIPDGTATDKAITDLISGTSVDDRWYLPTVAELIALHENMSKLPENLRTQLTGDFWTCELPANPTRSTAVEKTAYYVSFNGNSTRVDTADKFTPKNVIAVTQFMVK